MTPDDPAEREAAPRDAEERELLRALVRKYERMRALRERLGRGTPPPEERALLRALAADFPGALRELELLSTEELDRRLASARLAAEEQPAPAWLLWTALYHALMRRALRDRRGGPSVDPLPHGRLNVVVFAALAARFALPAEQIGDRLFPRTGRAARPYQSSTAERG